MSTVEFNFYATHLLLKSIIPDGSAGVYGFATQTSEGLIYVGRERQDVSYARVVIQNLAGTLAVGMIAHVPVGMKGDIMFIRPSLLKGFRFTVESIESKDRVRELITEAGIFPKSEDKEIN